MSRLHILLRGLAARYRRWQTRRILEGLTERQRKDVGWPEAAHWRALDPQPVMRHPATRAEPCIDASHDQEPFRKAG